MLNKDLEKYVLIGLFDINRRKQKIEEIWSIDSQYQTFILLKIPKIIKINQNILTFTGKIIVEKYIKQVWAERNKCKNKSIPKLKAKRHFKNHWIDGEGLKE